MKPKPVVAVPESSEEEDDDDDEVEENGSEGDAESEDNDTESSDDEKQEHGPGNGPAENDSASSSESDDEEDESLPSQPIPSKPENFAIQHIQDLLLDPSPHIDLPYKSALTQIDLAFQADLKRMCTAVVRKLSLRNLLEIVARDSSKYFKRDRRVMKAYAYQYFLKDYHAKNAHVAISDRRKMAASEYKMLTESQIKKYTDLAHQANILKGFLNEDGTPKPKAKVKRVKKEKTFNQADVSTLLPPFVTQSSKKTKTKTKTEPVPEMPDLFAKAKRSKDESEGEQPVQVNVFNYYSEHIGKGTKEEARTAFSRLSDKERVKLTYKIIQTINERCNQRVVLTKQDQEWLDKYEKRPSRPGTAYTVFMNEKNADPTLAHLAYRDRSSAIGALWGKLDPTEKAKYEEINKQQKKEYEAQHAAFLDNLPAFRREQEVAPKIRKPRKRRASVGETPVVDDVFNDVRTNSTFLNETRRAVAAEPAKRKQRSKTIDCSTMSIRDFFQANKVQEEVATPLKTGTLKRKAMPMVNGHESDVDEAKTVSPKKPKKKRIKTAEVEPELVSLAPVQAPVEASPKKSKTKKKVKEDVPIPAPVEDSSKMAKNKKKAIEKTPTVKITEADTFAASRFAGKAAKVKPRAPTPPPASSPIPATKSPKKKEKKVPEPEQPQEPEKKKKKKKPKITLTEPVAPPTTTKEYFKSIYNGAPETASKAYKKLALDEKRRYYEQLTRVTDQYVMDLSVYMNSLSGAEVELYNQTH